MSRPAVLITGSSGFIGTALAGRLLREGFRVLGMDRKANPRAPEGLEHLDADLTSDASTAAAMAELRGRCGGELASAVHLAAHYDFSGEPSPLYETLTVQGTGRVLDGLRGFRAEQFLFSSTMLVHAPCEPGQRIDEAWPIQPKWDYPRSKVQTEALIHARRGAVPAVILRIAGVYEDLCRSIPVAHQIQRIHERRLLSHVFPGDLDHGQAFVHVEDLAEAVLRAVARRRELGPEAVMLVGEPRTFSYGHLQRRIAELRFGERWETVEIAKPLAKAGSWIQNELPTEEKPFIKPWMIDIADDHYALDIGRARAALGWEPARSLDGTLPAMIRALEEDPQGWYQLNHLEPEPAAAR